MSNGNDQNNQQQNQGKQKGGGGGGQPKGLTLGSSFSASSVNNMDDMKRQAVGTAADSIAMIAAVVVGSLAWLFMKDTFKIKDGPAPAQGGGQAEIKHPGQLLGALAKLKDHPQMGEFAPKIKEALGE